MFTKPFKTGMSLDLARGPDFQRMTKGTTGEEVAMWYACTSDACALETRRRFVTERGKKEKKAESLTQASTACVIILVSHHCDLCDFAGTCDFG